MKSTSSRSTDRNTQGSTTRASAAAHLDFAPPCELSGRRSRPDKSPKLAGHLRALAQYEFLDFPGRGLRQWPEQHRPWDFEAGEVLAAEDDDLLGRGGRVGFQA